MTSMTMPDTDAPRLDAPMLELAAPGLPSAEITIAVPTFRRTQLLMQALRSVAAQTELARIEVLVVDNDPEADNEVLESLRALGLPRLRYFRNAENVGMFGNWNRCIALCRTEWITILNDDDLLLPGYVEEITRLHRRVDGVAYACACRVLDERPADKRGNRRLNLLNRLRALRPGSPVRTYGCLDYFLKNRHYGSLGILFRRRTAEEQAGFASSYYPSSDYNFFSGLTAHGKVTVLQKPLAVYRISVNESLKLETINRWREVDATIRRQLAHHVRAPAWMKERYIRLAARYEYLSRMRESKIGDPTAGPVRQHIRRLGTALGLATMAGTLRACHWAASMGANGR